MDRPLAKRAGVSVASISWCENVNAQLLCLGEEGPNSGGGAIYTPEVSWDQAAAGTSSSVRPWPGLASPFLCPALLLPWRCPPGGISSMIHLPKGSWSQGLVWGDVPEGQDLWVGCHSDQKMPLSLSFKLVC